MGNHRLLECIFHLIVTGSRIAQPPVVFVYPVICHDTVDVGFETKVMTVTLKHHDDSQCQTYFLLMLFKGLLHGVKKTVDENTFVYFPDVR